MKVYTHPWFVIIVIMCSRNVAELVFMKKYFIPLRPPSNRTRGF